MLKPGEVMRIFSCHKEIKRERSRKKFADFLLNGPKLSP
jgi:hypothetical protein